MKNKLRNIIDILLGRVARNIYFWLLLIIVRLQYDSFIYTRQEIYTCALSLMPLLFLLYINNLVLIPYLHVRKRHILYYPVVAVTIVATASLSAYILINTVHHVPGIDIYKVIWIPYSVEGDDLRSFTSLAVIHIITFTFYRFIFTLCWYLRDYQKKQKELIEIKRKQTETELAFLKSQLNPHFLFNTLNNLYGLALKKADNTPDTILKLSLILRYLLYESNTPLVSFEKEKEIMQAYIELELLRLTDTENLAFYITADGAYSVPPLLWLPVLENIFKHGTRYLADELSIEYRCTIENGVMNIYAKNSFKPDTSHIEKSGGIGIHNLSKRLSLLYPGRHKININQAGNTYIADIEIKLV